jgi:hypothetical protein
VRLRSVGALFGAYVAASAAHIAFIVAHEPFSFDAWNVAVDTHAQPITVARFFEYWRYEYAHSNPRLGQPLTYLTYKVAGFAELATPIAYLALTLAITVLGLGRVPRRGRDLAVWAFVVGFGWFALPQIGRNMFCRAYAANYVYTAAIQLWFLAGLRLAIAKPAAGREQAITFGLAGMLTGICNEHTGPALILFLIGYAWWLRRDGRPVRVPLASAIGVVIGFGALLLAPGQHERYGGLAQRKGLVDQVIGRGVNGALELCSEYLVYAAPLLGLLVLAVVVNMVATRGQERTVSARDAVRMVVVAVGAGLVVALTLCASPKLGSRFYLAPLAVLLAGFVAVVDATVISRRVLAGLVVVGVAASAYAAVRTVPLYRTVAAQGDERMAALEATTPGAVYVAEPFAQVGESWWFIGDDFRDAKKRAMVARYFGLVRVTLSRGRASRTAPQP